MNMMAEHDGNSMMMLLPYEKGSATARRASNGYT